MPGYLASSYLAIIELPSSLAVELSSYLPACLAQPAPRGSPFSLPFELALQLAPWPVPSACPLASQLLVVIVFRFRVACALLLGSRISFGLCATLQRCTLSSGKVESHRLRGVLFFAEYFELPRESRGRPRGKCTVLARPSAGPFRWPLIEPRCQSFIWLPSWPSSEDFS